MKLRCTAVSDRCENDARHTPPTTRLQGWCTQSRIETAKTMKPCALAASSRIIHSAQTKDTEEHCCVWVWAIHLKKEKKENAIRTFSRAFGLLTSMYTADLFFFLLPPSKRPHNASVLLPTRVTNRLNAIQLSWGNHGASVLTELKYYQPIWVSFHKYRNGCFPCGGGGGGGIWRRMGG